MSMRYIRDYYKVPAKRGGKVSLAGHTATITGSHGQYLYLLFDDGSRAVAHPTWQMEYLT